jgi:hypothetical protein
VYSYGDTSHELGALELITCAIFVDTLPSEDRMVVLFHDTRHHNHILVMVQVEASPACKNNLPSEAAT